MPALDMTPAQIAQNLGVREYVKLCSLVEANFKQKFGVLTVNRSPSGVTVVIALADDTRRTVSL